MQFCRIITYGAIFTLLIGTNVYAQLPAFSAFWRTPQLTAPTAMAGDQAYEITAHYRRQGFEEGSGYLTYLLSGQLPLYDRSGTHFGTLGINLMHDASGAAYLYATSGAMLTYMYDVNLSFQHHLVGGVQGSYYGRKIDWSRVTTSNQFVNGIFDPALGSGEQFTDDPSHAFLANIGLAYYFTDFEGQPVFHIGAALTNVNKGSFTYLKNSESQAVPGSIVSYAHIRLFSNPYYEVVSDLYWQHKSGISDIVGGFQVMKGTRPRVSVADNHLGVGLYYSQDHTGIIALQLIQPNWLFGISYDMVFGNRPLRSMQNAVEVSLGWRLDSDNRQKKYNPRKYRRKLPWQNKRRLPWRSR